MSNKSNYLANSQDEHKKIVEAVASSSTTRGHVNTHENPHDYLNIHNINYFHLNDNMDEKDSHIQLGEGSADFSSKFLKRVQKEIIELNNYEDVLCGKRVLLENLDEYIMDKLYMNKI